MKIVQIDSSQNASKCSVIEENLVAKQNFMAFDKIRKYDKFVHFKIWRISYQASKFWCFLIFELKLMKICLCGKAFFPRYLPGKRKWREVDMIQTIPSVFVPFFDCFVWPYLMISLIDDDKEYFFVWWFCPYWIFLRLMPDLNISENNTSESADEAPLWS